MIETLTGMVNEPVNQFARRQRTLDTANRQLDELKKIHAKVVSRFPEFKIGSKSMRAEKRQQELYEHVLEQLRNHRYSSAEGRPQHGVGRVIPEDVLAAVANNLKGGRVKPEHVESALAAMFFGANQHNMAAALTGLGRAQESFQMPRAQKSVNPAIRFLTTGSKDLKRKIVDSVPKGTGFQEVNNQFEYAFNELKKIRQFSQPSRTRACEDLEKLAPALKDASAKQLVDTLHGLTALHEYAPRSGKTPASQPNPLVQSMLQYIQSHQAEHLDYYPLRFAQFLKEMKDQHNEVPVFKALQDTAALWNDENLRWILPRRPDQLRPHFERLVEYYKEHPKDTETAIAIIKDHANRQGTNKKYLGSEFMNHVGYLVDLLKDHGGNRKPAERAFLNSVLPQTVSEQKPSGIKGSEITRAQQKTLQEKDKKIDDKRAYIASLRKKMRGASGKGRRNLEKSIESHQKELKTLQEARKRIAQGQPERESVRHNQTLYWVNDEWVTL